MASFSRLQLAAALLEYDNDPDDPTTQKKSAYDSAIFSHLRRANGSIHAKSETGRRSADFLGVSLPSDAGATQERMNSRKSRATVTELYNPFGEDEFEEEPGEEEPLEVDLASWGLDSLMPKEKGSRASRGMKGKAKSDVFPTARQAQAQPRHGDTMSEGGSRMPHSRSMSLPLNAVGEALGDAQRRNSISNPLDIAEFGELERPGPRRRFSNHPLIESLPIRPPLMTSSSLGENKDTIPFPSASPIPEDSREGSRAGSQLDNHPEGHNRTYSTASFGTNAPGGEIPNPFAIPPPPASRASRFDPKYAAAARTTSNATRLSTAQQPMMDENEYKLGPRASFLDRRISTTSFGTRNMLDDDFQSAYGEEFSPRERRYSRLDLMRPKVLIMPSPLQNTTNSAYETQKSLPRDGFLDSSDGRPLPPGARTSVARLSMLGPSSSVNVPVPSNSFTPNPRLNLTPSQLLFRNTLMVDGQRDVTYNDIDGNLRRADKDGEQVKVDIPEEPEEKPKSSPVAEQAPNEPKPRRPPGKLFGRSLIDDLEARKAEMRNKQRVFTGDQRPSMMDRKMTRSSTLIDPASLGRSQSGKGLEASNTEPALTRRNSRGGQPLLTFDDNGMLGETGNRESTMPKSRSVFGVDKLWEREMAKLKEIEAQEKLDAEERRKQAEAEAKISKKKKKGKRKEEEHTEDALFGEPSFSATSNVSASQLREPSPSIALPQIAKVTATRRDPASTPAGDDSDDESSASEAEPRQSTSSALRDKAADKWVSDDEGGPIRSTGVGLRFPSRPAPLTSLEDSDEDVPLSVTLQRAAQKLAVPRSQPDDDSDEDRPLSALLDKPKSTMPSIDFDHLASPVSIAAKGEDDDEDNVPLGVRVSRFPNSSLFSGMSQAGGNADDDDRPLAMHPEQLRKSQFMLAQAQAQQQQMLQAQLYQSMVFNPQPNMMMMAPPPMQFAAPTPLAIQSQDAAKFNRVDKWRQDVAIEQS